MTNKILIAGLVGAVVAFLLGYLTWGLLLVDTMESNSGSASGVIRSPENMLWLPMILGHISWGLLIAIIFGRWANISTFSSGLQAGALLGFLIGFTYDMINLGSTHLLNTTGTIIDIVAMTIISAIVGGVVGFMLGRGN